MHAILLFYGRAYTGTGPQPSADNFQRIVDAHLRYERDVLRTRASVVLGQALSPAVTARTVSFTAPGTQHVEAGPAVATDEALGGFYVIECRDLDEAQELASLYPMPPGFGRIEVRLIVPFDPALRQEVLAGAGANQTRNQ